MSFSDEEQALERTFVMVKPEGAQRRLIGQIVSRFERSGLKLVALKFVQPTIEQLTDHYIEHIDRDYFSSMIEYLSTGGPVVPIVLIGPGSVALARRIIGLTDPSSCLGCLWGDFAISIKRSTIHGADSTESAEREISIWFEKEELLTHK